MGDFRSIAAVTATLQRTLQDAVQTDVAGAIVTTVRPTDGESSNLPATGVNLYLYRVSPNPHWRNADLPARRSGGEPVQRPAAAIDLHFLLSFYGSDLTLEPQRLLGSAVAFLHGEPLISRSQIAATVADPTKPFLAGSDLAEDVEQVRVVPAPLTLEEVSRLWSVLLQTKYVLSVCYQASVLLIEQQVTTKPALPARAVNFATVPLRQPYIRRVVSQAGEDAPILSGSAVAVEGDDLRSDLTIVTVDGIEAASGTGNANRIGFPLPTSLRAGPHTVQVRQGVRVGAAASVRMGASSNLAAFVLQPAVTRTGSAYNIVISDVQGTGTGPRSATIAIQVQPAVASKQSATLEMLTAQGVAYVFMAAARTEDMTELQFAVSGVSAGSYLMRVRVDGAESPFDLDADRVAVAPAGTLP